MIQDHLWSTVYFKGLFSAQLLRCYWQPVHIQLQYSDDVIVGFLLQLPDSDRVLTMQRTVKLIIISIIDDKLLFKTCLTEKSERRDSAARWEEWKMMGRVTELVRWWWEEAVPDFGESSICRLRWASPDAVFQSEFQSLPYQHLRADERWLQWCWESELWWEEEILAAAAAALPPVQEKQLESSKRA